MRHAECRLLGTATGPIAVVVVGPLLLLAGCEPSLSTSDPRERMRAVQKETDQAALAKVALEDNKKYLRLVAVEQLTDQTVLARVAVGDRDEEVRRAAVQKVTDPKKLAKVEVQAEQPA